MAAKMDCSLSPELAAMARRELNETPSVRAEGVKEMRKKIQEHRRNSQDSEADDRTDDEFLLRFLRCKKHDVGRSFSVYQSYHKFRRDSTNIFEGMDAFAVSHVWHSGVTGVLPARDRKGRSVMVGFPGRWVPSEHSLEDVLRALIMQLEYLIDSEETQITGIVLIADFSGFSLHQARSLKPWYFQTMTSLVQNAFPARFKGVYITNQPWYINILLALIRPFLSEKMNKRIHLLGSGTDTLHEHFDPDTLPAELGGTQPDYNGGEWVRTITEDQERRSSTASSAPEPSSDPPVGPVLLNSRQTTV